MLSNRWNHLKNENNSFYQVICWSKQNAKKRYHHFKKEKSFFSWNLKLFVTESSNKSSSRQLQNHLSMKTTRVLDSASGLLFLHQIIMIHSFCRSSTKTWSTLIKYLWNSFRKEVDLFIGIQRSNLRYLLYSIYSNT